MSREVPAKVFEFLRELGVYQGRDVEGALRGLSLRHVDTNVAGARVDWNDLAVFMNRMFDGLSVQEMEKAGEDYVRVNAWIQMALAFFGTPRLLYFGVAEMTKALGFFPHMRTDVELQEASLHIEFHLPETFEPCPFFFHGTTGEYRQMNTLFGKPQAHVEAHTTGRSGIYEIFFTDAPTALDRIFKTGINAYDGVAGEFRRLLLAATGTSASSAEASLNVIQMQKSHGLTLAEARVASRLAKGRSVPEIGLDLKISTGTVRSHLKASYAKTGARSQAELVRIVLGGQTTQ
ncbi:MAG: LuxR C-terminal-related transcriptional regulator [Myxococcales bacterium]|nr:LuxR C-terminal-related transcriptional regulator [Myxococcales bacterium]